MLLDRLQTSTLAKRLALQGSLKLFAVLSTICIQTSCHSQAAPTGKITQAVFAAQQSKQKSITIPLPLMMQMGLSSLNEELNRSFALSVYPVAKAETLNKNGDVILTWYKLRLLKAYSHSQLGQHEDQSAFVAHIPDIPRPLLPVAKDEIIVRFIGGTMAVDGVRVTDGSPDDNLVLGKNYLLFAGRIGFNDGSVSNTEFAPLANWSSVFKFSADGDSLIPLLPQQNSAVQEKVLEEFHGHLHELSARAPEMIP